ncbi:RNA-binding protein [Desulfitobacterium sp.]|uniref:YlmH family RNA-binding protein n=1 Tax=Desulfitobacterium sp. TaxID=49981 RepID=UPI002B2178F8|nr:YlmH/Sll1252 family protein [Desulfitobacterium sp.]MEA4900072.1 YlmH/Sll1252 family protein [Desulfitobacterium sp.]
MKHRIDRHVLSFWQDKEMRLEAAHLLDLTEEAMRKQLAVRTPFLGLGLAQWFERVLQKESLSYQARGGFPDAERVCYFLGQNTESLEYLPEGITLLAVVSTDPHVNLEHRQILGSLMGLGLKRELVGDIRPGVQGMIVAVVDEITDYLLLEWCKAGRVNIRVERVQGDLMLREDPGEERRITVSSSRIDAIAAAGFNVARGVVQEWVRQGKIKRNDLIISKPDLEVKSGDIISCRGQGRLRLCEAGETRKGRIGWSIILYRIQKR